MANRFEARVRDDPVDQSAAELPAAIRGIDDDIEDQCLVEIVGQHPRESHKPLRRRGAESHHDVGVFEHSAGVGESTPPGPPLGLIEAVQILDLGVIQRFDRVKLHGYLRHIGHAAWEVSN